MIAQSSLQDSNRSNHRRGMRFQPRDANILWAIYVYGGVLARRHLQYLFWPNASLRAMLRRLSLLVEHKYLERPNRDQRRTKPIPEPIYWIGPIGAQWLVEQLGVEVDPPKNDGENQMRLFHSNLLKKGMRWLREPKWNKTGHDLLIVDFRIVLEKSVMELPNIILEQWVLEGEFRSKMDKVEYQVSSKDGKVEKKSRGVCPDGFFIIADDERKSRNELHRLPCLLEIDMATHDNPSFGREKAAPYAAYIKSPAYNSRFGLNTGIWLVVTTGELRMKNLIRQTEISAGHDAKFFFFTTLDKLKRNNILISPIWWRSGRNEPESLISK